MRRNFLRIFVVLVTCAFSLSTLWAQIPEKISYQAVIRNNQNHLMIQTQIGMRISILKGTEDGNAVYVETQTPSTNSNGLVSIEIGTGITGDDFSAIDWADGTYFIKTETDITGGINYTITGTSQLLSVPYALHSKAAETVTGTITETQTLADVIALDNSANNASITNLADPAEDQDAATKAYVDELKGRLIALEDIIIVAGLYNVSDIDGNSYNVIKIGNQVWMDSNLKTTRYNDGTPIPLVTDLTAWSALDTPGYCWYDNDSATYARTYGAFYNWYAVNTGKLCPEGWHVPTDGEWTILTDYLGGAVVAGKKLKETGTEHWASPNTEATNESGFTALPAGYRFEAGGFEEIGQGARFWSSTMYITHLAWNRVLYSDSDEVFRFSFTMRNGYSVRCLRD